MLLDSIRTTPQPTSFADMHGLRERLLGEVITATDTTYDAARRVWNKAFLKQPQLIVRAADALDVSMTVAYARKHQLALAIRSGGHSLAGFGSVDDGVVLDLSRMKAISIDPDRQIATVQPGVTSEELAPVAARYGLGLSTGDAPTVGVGGLTLGGGIGFMVRKYGLSIDSLLSADIVTANGHFHTVSADEQPDLFWALRGGGGNFGVVTSFEFQLRPVGTILGGPIVYPATTEVIKTYTQRAAEAPDGLTTISFVIKAPPLPFIPQELHGKVILLILAVHVGSLEAGQRALEPLRRLGPGLVDATSPMPYPGIFDFTRDPTVSSYHYGRTTFLYDFPEPLIDVVLDHVEHGTSPLSFAQIRPLGGAMGRVPSGATAFAHRDKPFMLALINDWDGPNADNAAPHKAWVSNFWNAVRPFRSNGVYVNFLEVDERARIGEAYPTETYARLAAIKHQYDPTNVFRLNQNIAPAS